MRIVNFESTQSLPGQIRPREHPRRRACGQPHPGAAERGQRQRRALHLRRLQRGRGRREQRAVSQRQV